MTMNFDESMLGNNEKFAQALAQLNDEERKSLASSFRKQTVMPEDGQKYRMELKPEILQMNSFRENNALAVDQESMMNDTMGAASV